MKKLLFSILLVLITFFSKADWNHYYPCIIDVTMINSSLGYAIGDNGLLLKYDGNTWNKIESSTLENFTCMDFNEMGEGWIGTASGKIYYYNNEIISIFSNIDMPICAIDMVNANLGYLSTQGLIYKYNGSNWTVDYDSGSFGTCFFNDIHINNENDVWIAGLDGILLWFNGTDWQTINLNTNDDLNSVYFDNGKGYIVSEYSCYYYDGFSWNEIAGEGGEDIWGDNINNIWITGYGSIKHYNGSIWSNVVLPPAVNSKKIYCIFLTDSQNGWAFGENMTILNIINGLCNIYYSMPTNENLRSISFTDQNNGWAVGYAGTILHYNGLDWTNYPSPTIEDLNSVFFITSDNGWAVGRNGCILHFNENSWQLFESPVSTDLYSVHFSDAENGWITGFDSDGSYTLKFNTEQWDINNTIGGWSIHTYNTDHTWISVTDYNYSNQSFYGELYKYTSGAWLVNEMPEGLGTYNIQDISFIDPSRGFAVAYDMDQSSTTTINSKIFSFASGTGWTNSFGPTQSYLNAIDCVDQNNCWTCGSYGIIRKWDGSNWYDPQFLNRGCNLDNPDFKDLAMINMNIGWAVGDNGVICFTQNGGAPINYSSEIASQIENNRLSLYPNPANEMIYISGFLPNELSRISIYTIQGQLIYCDLVEEYMTSIDISNFSSGLYICTINFNSGTETYKITKY